MCTAENSIFPPVADLNESGDALLVLDQTLLPWEEKLLSLKQPEEVYAAIYQLKVRGAPAIGVAAAFGLYLAMKDYASLAKEAFFRRLGDTAAYLGQARPTAVNLFMALERLQKAARAAIDLPNEQIINILRQEAESLRDEDRRLCAAIGENGLSLLSPHMRLLTHCNAGRLATAGSGTALAPIYLGHSRGYDFQVFADETRPLLQGARLTAYELSKSGVRVTLLCDNMAASLMSSGQIDAVLVGADRITGCGDTANKIGTLSVAVLCHHFHIPFYVCAPSTTIDHTLRQGSGIPIEQRPPAEVTASWYARPLTIPGIGVYNPAFDVTPAELISAIITEDGVFRPPFNF